MTAYPSINGEDISQKKIGIVGLGPVGLILAAHLQEANCEVAICDTDKLKINLIRREGIQLEGVIQKQVRIKHICNHIEELWDWDMDILILALKSYQLPAVLKTFREEDDFAVISAQNGIDVEQEIAEEAGEPRTLRMVINFAGNLNAPNVVKVTFFNPPNYLSSVDDSLLPMAKDFATQLTAIGLETLAIDSFELIKRVWEKTILNASLSALCGIGKFTIKEAMEFPDTVEIIEQVIEEAVEVAEAEKIYFEDDFIRKCLRYLKKAGNHFPSLAVDIINNRETEIDHINGKFVEYGRKHYIRTSLNLVFTNMVKAMTQKSLKDQLGIAAFNLSNKRQKGLNIFKNKKDRVKVSGPCYLGIDLGSAFTKFTVIDEEEKVVYQTILPTLNRDKVALKHVMQAIRDELPIQFSCATGYGRKHFPDSDIIKTEILCAAAGVSRQYPGEKNIIDIGGEDIKVIRCDADNKVDKFYLNDKCAAGTGAFIQEVAERAEIPVSDMSNLASKSDYDSELNSFCTVFAKTEIMSWLFSGAPVEDIARGIYISITNRVSKLRVDTSVPVYLVGGVIAHHPFLKTLLQEKYERAVEILPQPQYTVSFGAAILARRQYQRNLSGKEAEKTESI